jgi:two-component system, NtrC family, response regulator AtoC
VADTLLIIEDEDLLGNELLRHYQREGWEVTRASDLAQASHALLDDGLDPLVVLSDMSLPDGNALDLLETLRGQSTGGEWILLTGYGTVPDSVRALRCGAYDFLEKPCPTARLDLVIAGAARSARAQRRLREQTAVQNRRYTPEAMVGSSRATQAVRDMLRKLSRVPFTALVIGGETGTGKGLAVRILHYCGSRSLGPLVELNCAALPPELLESEIFGHEPGAFTGARGRHRGLFEQANGGTLFLDEIGELTPALQAKLLKVVEDRRVRRLAGEREIEVDVQVVAASNRDLARQVAGGVFREDLYHRLNVFHLDVPPLREREADIEDLVMLFVAELNAVAGKRVRIVPEAVWSKLRAHSWPGNVRELRNVIERCVLFSEGEELPAQWLQLPEDVAPPPAGPLADTESPSLRIPLDGSMSLDDMDKYIIEQALDRSAHNVTAAARALGTTRQTLRYRIQKYGLKSSG